MESLLTTEIARLVYGYLIEENCESAAQTFLETSLHLKECLMVVKKGRRFNTKVLGNSLVELLDKLCEVTSIVRAHIDNNEVESAKEINLLQHLTKILIPHEEKRICFGRVNLLNTEQILKERQDEMVNNSRQDLEENLEKCLQECRDNSVIDDLCQSPFKILEHPESSNEGTNINTLLEQNINSTVAIKNPVISSDEEKLKANCGSIIAAPETDCLFNTNVDPRVESYNDENRQSVLQPSQSSQLYSSETLVENKEINISTKITKDVRNGAGNMSITTASSSTTALKHIVNCSTLPPLAIPFTPLRNQNQTALARIRMQLNSSPKIHVSLLNNKHTLHDIEKYNQLPESMTSTAACDLIPGPTRIFIKQPQNQTIKNIFTNENIDVIKPKERYLLIKPAPVPAKTTDSPIIKRSGVRTRGGFVKTRGAKFQRRVKAHVPTKMNDFKPENVDSRSQASSLCIPDITNIDSIGSLITPIKDTPEKVESCVNRNLNKDSDEKLTVNLPNIVENSPLVKSEDTVIKNLRKRISLSVPRRGSHIRTLDFKTPTKNNSNCVRRAITSPKQIHANRLGLKKSFRNIRGALFKTSGQNKDSKAWDADLRIYTAEPTDIPASVGLQRKNNAHINNGKTNDRKKKKSVQNKGKTDNVKSSRTQSEESDEALAHKIEQEVLSVIGEENVDFGGIPNLTGHNDELHKGDDCGIIAVSDKNQIASSPTSTPEKHSDLVKINSFQTNVNNSLEELTPDPLVLMTPDSKTRNVVENGFQQPIISFSPGKLCITIPSKDNRSTDNLLTASPGFNLSCQDSLESSLIIECKRIETENLKKNTSEKENNLGETCDRLIGKEENNLIRSSTVSNNAQSRERIEPQAALITSESGESKILCSPQQEKVKSVKSSHLKPPSVPLIPIDADDKSPSPVKPKAVTNNQTTDDLTTLQENYCNRDCKQEQSISNVEKSSWENDRINFQNDLAPLSEENSSPEKDNCIATLHKTVKTKNEQQLKTKNGKNSKNVNIDCSKLIAQCLQKAKENLYRTEVQVNSVTKEKTRKKVDRQVASHGGLLGNLTIKKINKLNNSSNIATSEEVQTRIKNINKLLSSDSNSSSSDLSEDEKEITEFNTSLKNHVEHLDSTTKRNSCTPEKSKRTYEKLNDNGCISNKTPQNRGHLKGSLALSPSPRLKTRNLTPESPDDRTTNVHTDEIKSKAISRVGRVNITAEQDAKALESSKYSKVNTYENKSRREKVNDDCGDINSYKRNVCIQSSNEVNCEQGGKHIEISGRTTELDDYVYNFTLTLDGRNVTKQLKVSPFYTIFELESNNENIDQQNEKRAVKDSYSRHSSSSDDRSRKRKCNLHLGEGTSKDDRLVSPAKIHKRDKVNEGEYIYKQQQYYSRSERPRSYRYDDSRLRTSRLQGARNSARGARYSHRYYTEYTRLRRYSPHHGWSSRRINTSRRAEISSRNEESLKRTPYRTDENSITESSHRYHKDIRNVSNKREELDNTNERTLYKSNRKSSTSPQRYTVKSIKDKKLYKMRMDKEDGELTDESSLSVFTVRHGTLSSSNNTHRPAIESPPVDEGTREKLKKVNLDHFLSILHGTEKK